MITSTLTITKTSKIRKLIHKIFRKNSPTGKAIICKDNKNLKNILKKIKNKNILTYGESKNADYQISNIRYNVGYSIFDLTFKDIDKKNKKIKIIYLKLLGKHNVLNAAAAVTVCINLGVSQNIIKQSLKKFSGVQRRMTKIFSNNKNDFYDDYAHHPTEISSILDGVKNVYKDRKIISVFEPHRYSRFIFRKEFASSFFKSDLVILCPLYAAGEIRNNKFNQLNFAKKYQSFQKLK